jgi:hypothetical protein
MIERAERVTCIQKRGCLWEVILGVPDNFYLKVRFFFPSFSTEYCLASDRHVDCLLIERW